MLQVRAPLAGWVLALAEVPDEVFAGGMAGDGVAIDPTGNVVCAPFDGEVVPVGEARHAVTIRAVGGIDVLVHVGIDTVGLKGEGFEMLVAPGQRVAAGAPLLRFDMDAVARRARSLVTPVILAGAGVVRSRVSNRLVAVGEPLFEVEGAAAGAARGDAEAGIAQARMRVPFEHGLHVRPAALLAAALKPFSADVQLGFQGRRANARSSVALMALGAHCGDTVEVRASGADAAGAIDALSRVLSPVLEGPPPAGAAQVPASGRIEAVIASRGVSTGVAAGLVQREVPVEEKGAGADAEARALDGALESLQRHLAALAETAAGPRRELLRAHAELVRDPELVSHANSLVRAGRSAGHAWRQATRATAEALGAMADARMNERAADLRDLEGQVLRILRGEPPAAGREIPVQAIVIADDLLPSQLIALDASRIAGICLARGGATSHLAILAASAGIPALVAAGPAVLAIADDTPLILDAERGWLDVDPPKAQLAAAAADAAQRATERSADLAGAREPALTADGVRVIVNANAGSVADARAAVENGADGCGLLRTEFLFLDRREAPDEEEQAREYERIAAAFAGRPVSIRTLDVGGDKPIAYLPLPREENPALGLRGVRVSLAHPQLLRAQLAAIIRAAASSPCRILVPMVNDAAELAVVRDMAVACARDAGLALPPLGVMIETPAAALGAAALARHADFLSIGSNDLAQYALAIDRGHADLARGLDALHPTVLLLIAATVEGARTHGRSVSVCGAMASDVEALPLLLGLGVREISATPSAIPRLKRLVRALHAGECARLVGRALDQESAAGVRALVQSASGSRQ
jgi:phosphoenolpyruvate-protein phosphotransferase